MVAKCANPSCSTPFRYLNQGRLFHLPANEAPVAHAGSQGKPAMEHFWLCDACAARLTLTAQGRAVALVGLVPGNAHMDQEVSR